MIALPTGTRIWIAAGVTDLRRGFTGLSAMVQTKLEQDPFSGHVFVFRGRRGHLLKVFWWNGQGLCLFAKKLDRISRKQQSLRTEIARAFSCAPTTTTDKTGASVRRQEA